MTPIRFLWLALLAAQTVFLSGCTVALWESDHFSRYHDPARPANLRVYQSRQKDDVLVLYDEQRDDRDKTRRRAYWLNANGEPVKNPHRPRFVSANQVRQLDEVPVIAFTNAPADTGLCAVLSTNQAFSLFHNGAKLADYELPVYADASGTTKQVLLTPFAVVADLTVIGGFIFLQAWAAGGLHHVH